MSGSLSESESRFGRLRARVGSASRLKPTSQSTVEISESFRFSAEQEARDLTTERFEHSEFGRNVRDLPMFHINELVLGKRLGKGGFSNVDEIRGICLRDNARGVPKKSRVGGGASRSIFRKFPKPLALERHDTIAINNQESRQFIADHCFRRSGDPRYAIKMVRPDILRDEKTLVLGLCDLAIETMFLSGLEHPNIIKLRAISSGNQFTGSYFLVLDRLNDTLQSRILVWRQQKKRLFSVWARIRYRNTSQRRLDLFESRLERAFDLSSAMEYLHRNKVIHRDIKPDNCGFDCRDDIKIFDFGLARELRQDYRQPDGNFRLSKMTGSLRYMAPEVFYGRPYNSSCDVYSFSCLFWEILALQKPYSQHSSDEKEFVEHVFEKGIRPEMKRWWPQKIRDLLERGWSEDPNQRMEMAEITATIRTELVRLRHGDESAITDHSRRRSTDVFGNEIKAAVQELGDRSSDVFDRSVKSNRSLKSRGSARSNTSGRSLGAVTEERQASGDSIERG